MTPKDCMLFYADQNGRKHHPVFSDENDYSISVSTINNKPSKGSQICLDASPQTTCMYQYTCTERQ
jgi:hypothetical protein